MSSCEHSFNLEEYGHIPGDPCRFCGTPDPVSDSLSLIPTTEMDQKQWLAFRDQWIVDYTQGYIEEGGMDPKDAKEYAEFEFENYVGQEGYTGRDERIFARRFARRERDNV